MIVRESLGTSFKGWFQYHFHDKQASTRRRIGWTRTLNMITEDPAKAWKVMAYTAKSAQRLKEVSGASQCGRKLQLPVLSYSLSWHPEQSPTEADMLEAVSRSMQALGMDEYEGLVVEHTDTPHKHVHVALCRVHPITGQTASRSHTRRKLSAFAHQLELEGRKIYCQQRKENHEMRQQGKPTAYRDPIIQEAWNHSRNGQEFAAALEANHYHLAQGRKRLVIVDHHGRIHAPTRHIENIRARDLRQKLSDLNLSHLPDADAFSQAVQKRRKQEYEEYQQHKAQAEAELQQLEQRHQRERRRLFDEQNRQLRRQMQQLASDYRLDDLNAAIVKLESKCQKPVWWRRLLGLAGKDRTRLERLKRKCANAQLRMEERITGLESAHEQAMQLLQARQAQERVQYTSLKLDERTSVQASSIRTDFCQQALKPSAGRQAPEHLLDIIP